MRIHFTELAVKQLKPAATIYWDKTTPAFGIRVGKHARTWVVIRGRSRERTIVGRYPDLSLSAARLEARKLLLTAPEPKVERVSVDDAKRQFLEENYRDCAARTKEEAARVLNKHFSTLPSKLSDIDDTHVKVCLDRLSRTPSEQLHAYRTVRCFLRWCVRPPRKFIKHSPMEGYEAPSKDRRGTRILSDGELRAVWKATEDPPLRVVRLLILWGTRNTETVSIQRKWVQDGVLTIPGTHTKNRAECQIHTLGRNPGSRSFFYPRLQSPVPDSRFEFGRSHSRRTIRARIRNRWPDVLPVLRYRGRSRHDAGNSIDGWANFLSHEAPNLPRHHRTAVSPRSFWNSQFACAYRDN